MLDLARGTRVPGVEFRLGDLTALPVEDASFDFAIARSRSHTSADPATRVAELARAVRPGGRIVLTDAHPTFVPIQGQATFPTPGGLAFVRNHPVMIGAYLAAFRASGLTVLDCLEGSLVPDFSQGMFAEAADAATALFDGVPVAFGVVTGETGLVSPPCSGCSFSGRDSAAWSCYPAVGRRCRTRSRSRLIDQSDSFVFGYSKLDVMFGRETLDAVRHPYRDIAKPSVDVPPGEVKTIDPAAEAGRDRRRHLRRRRARRRARRRHRPELTPGLVEGGNEFYSVAGAERCATSSRRSTAAT